MTNKHQEFKKSSKFIELFETPIRNGLFRPTYTRGKGIKMINMGEIFSHGRIGDVDMELVPLNESEYERFLLKKNDLLFARASLTTGAGKCCIFVGNEPTTFESHVIRIRINSKLADPRFYYYYFNSNAGKQLIETIVEKTTASGIRTSDLSKLIVPFPTLDTQIQISNLFETIDQKIELNQQMNKTLESISQSIFKYWFINFEFPNEQGKPYRSSGGEMVYNEELRKEVPKGWRVDSIYEIADVAYGAPFSSKMFNKKKQGLPLIRIRDLKDSDPEFYTTEQHPNATVICAGDIIAGMDAEFRPHIWLGEKSYLNQRLCHFKPKNNIHRYFVLNIVRPLLRFFENAKVGTTVIHLGKSDIDTWKVIIPTDKLNEKFSVTINPIFNRLVNNSLENRILGTIRDSLLPKLMSGKIRVPVEAR